MNDAIKTAPRGKDGEALLSLSQTSGIVRKMAEINILHRGEYTCVFKGQKVRVTK